jgi:hypothetical protein
VTFSARFCLCYIPDIINNNTMNTENNPPPERLGGLHVHYVHQAEHRSPRVLIINKRMEKELLVYSLDCYCLKYCAKGSDNVHVLDDKGDGALLEKVRTALKSQADKQQAYDVIIIPAGSDWEGITRFAEQCDPKPGILVLCHPMAPEASHKAYEKGAITITLDDLITHAETIHTPSGYDKAVEKAIGNEGMARLKLKPGEISATETWKSHRSTAREI